MFLAQATVAVSHLALLIYIAWKVGTAKLGKSH